MACKGYYLYKHTTPNGKIYIGITKQELRLRWANGHGYKHCKHFFNAILKYGWDNIQHEVLFENLSREESELYLQLRNKQILHAMLRNGKNKK